MDYGIIGLGVSRGNCPSRVRVWGIFISRIMVEVEGKG